MADEIQNIKIRIIGEADFSQLDQSINKITAEEKQLKEQIKGVDQAAKEANKSIVEGANQTSQAVNQTNKSFDGLKDKVKGLASQIPGAFQVQQILDFGKGVQGATGGIGGMSSALAGLKTAFLATGIGAFVLAIVSLISYFKQTDEGAEQLEGAMGALGAIVGRITGLFAELGSWLVKAVSSTKNFKEALSDLGDTIVTNVINRFKSVIVLGEAIGKLFEGDFAGAAKKANDAFIQFNLGIENGTDKLTEFGEEMSKAAKEAYDYAIALDAIDDRTRELGVQTAKVNQEVSKLIIQAKNRTLSEQERIALFEKANKLEEDNINDVLANERKRLSLIQERNRRKQEEINQLGSNLSINDELAQEEADQIIKITNLETESANLIERNQNRIDMIREAGIAKRKADNDKRLKELNEFRKAEEEYDTKEKKAIESLSEFRIAQEAHAFDEVAQNEENSIEIRIDAIEQRLLKEQELLKQRSEYDIANFKGTEAEKLLLLAKFEKDESDLIDKSEKDKQKIRDKAAEEEKKAEQKLADDKKSIREKEVQAAIQLGTTIVSGLFQLRKDSLNQDLQALKDKQDKELALVGDNKQAQAVINAKFAREEAKLKAQQAQSDKEQAIFNILISTAQGVIRTLAQTPPPLGLPLAALMAATGAAQLSFVAARPIPKFNKGTKSVPGYDFGDDSVLAMLRPGEGVMPVDRMKDYRPAFNAIFDRKVPADFLNSIIMNYDRLGQGLPSSSNDISGIQSELKGLRKDISNLQILQVNMDKKGFKTYLQSDSSKSEIENNYLRSK